MNAEIFSQITRDRFGTFGGLCPTTVPSFPTSFPVKVIRDDFPFLRQSMNGKPLVWFDNAATTQKPRCVIDRIKTFYERENSNIHRGAHTFAERATDLYEDARAAVADFLNAPKGSVVVFIRGATEGLNLIAQSYVKPLLEGGDEILLTALEHHANIVPWQMIAKEKNAVIRAAPVDNGGDIILSEYEKLITDRTKFISITHVSNAIGTVAPIAEMIDIAHRHGVRVAVDGAQSVSHLPIDLSASDADFFVFSGHKLFAPTGIGALCAKSGLLDGAPPYQGGGNMISDVAFTETKYAPLPARFEAGTGNIAGAVALREAILYVRKIGLKRIEAYEKTLTERGIDALKSVKNLSLVGSPKRRAGILSFVIKDVPVGVIERRLNDEGIAVRAGHHCAQPILRRLGFEATVRPSLAFYNTDWEIDRMVRALNF
ncbi:MAG: cysteine desulfurase [Clostridiales bacterium]|jgi:cysteine desulfurase/selenocysteine lyase|nr:cysteine desulfurase [Clostridiales bacterium]